MNRTNAYEKSANVIFWLLCSYVAVLLLSKWLSSFQSTMTQDVSFLYYLSWLVNEHGYIPYKDLLDTSFPGTFIFHSLIGNIFGYTHLSFHIVNSLYLIALMVTTWLLLKPVEIRVAAAAVLMTGLYYFNVSESMHFQRDYLCILPISAALLIARDFFHKPDIQGICAGFCLAVAVSIKPNYLLMLPAIHIGMIIFSRLGGKKLSIKNELRRCLFVGLGFLAWLLVCVIWLYSKGALNAFYEMATEFLPLYMKLDGGQSRAGGMSFWPGFIYMAWSSVSAYIVIVLLTGFYVWPHAQADKKTKILFGLLTALVVLAFICVLVGKKGWDYHWMPFHYFVILACSFLFLRPPLLRDKSRSFILLLAILIFFGWYSNYINSPNQLIAWIKRDLDQFGEPVKPSAYSEELIDYLKDKTMPGEKIELRVTGTVGAFFPALLELQLVPSTRYPIHLVLYRNIDDPYVQSLTSDMLKQLASPPRYLLDDNQFSLLAKPDGSPGFPEYEEFLQKNYRLVFDNRDHAGIPNQFLVYQRIDTIQ